MQYRPVGCREIGYKRELSMTDCQTINGEVIATKTGQVLDYHYI
jgi:hypothetical protein